MFYSGSWWGIQSWPAERVAGANYKNVILCFLWVYPTPGSGRNVQLCSRHCLGHTQLVGASNKGGFVADTHIVKPLPLAMHLQCKWTNLSLNWALQPCWRKFLPRNCYLATVSLCVTVSLCASDTWGVHAVLLGLCTVFLCSFLGLWNGRNILVLVSQSTQSRSRLDFADWQGLKKR